jgi:HEAT repeat protein
MRVRALFIAAGLLGATSSLQGETNLPATGARPPLGAPIAGNIVESLEKDALPDLMRSLMESKDDRPLRRLQIIGSVSGRAATPHLLAAYDAAGSDGIRCQILHSMGEERDPRLIPWLVERLHDTSPRIQCFALWALGEMRRPEAAAAIREKLWNLDPYVQMAAVDALGKTGRDPRMAAEIAFFMGDSNVQLRYLAAKAMGGLATPSMLPQFLERLDFETSVDVQEALVRSYVQAGRRLAVDRLISLLRDGPDPVTQHWIAVGLSSAEPEWVLPALRSLLEGSDAPAKRAAARVLAQIDVEALEKGPQDWVSMLMGWKESRDVVVQAAAEQLLRRLDEHRNLQRFAEDAR